MAMIEKIGYGQVEPNHLSAQRTAQIYAQLPLAEDITSVENGSFLKYDYVKGVADTSTENTTGEYLLVFNEVKIYDPARKGYKDYVMKSDPESTMGAAVPRLFKTNDGDIFTTNLVDFTTEEGSRVGKLLVPKVGSEAPYDKVAVLTESTPAAGDIVFAVVKETTMPDGQYAVKVQRLYEKPAE